MKTFLKLPRTILICSMLLFISSTMLAQTKRLKRPNSAVGIFKVDDFVSRSFNIYDRVYQYDGYAKQGKALEDDDYEAMIDVVDEVSNLTAVAPDVLSSLEGQSVLKKGKATLQINRAKKALAYSLKMAKKLIAGQDSSQTDKEEDSDTNTASTSEDSSETEEGEATIEEEVNQEEEESSNVSDNLEIYSKYDFVPGDKLLFFDDFSKDFIGDFPSKWNTNASGEVVEISDKGKWFELKSGYGVYFIPDVKDLPQDYTIEFDLITQGLSKSTSSTARINIILSDNPKFNDGSAHSAIASLPVGQYGAFSIRIRNYFNRGGGDVNTDIKADIRDEVLNQPHVAISVTKNRYRLWVNEVKYVDVPRFIQELDVLKYLKFHVNSLKDGEEHIYISNLKVAEGGQDLRRQLIEEGSVSTNGILFDSGSANIQPQSYGIIRQISQVLLQEGEMKLTIVGHTDSDGTDEANLSLSKKRAEAVKNALISVYNISGNRLQTEGKGESVAVGDNTTTEGKAQNRRVEFVKM